MLAWLETYEPILGLALQALMAVIWICYLQVLIVSLVRQRRPVILIHRSAGIGDAARCFVSNMGAEPIYLISIVAELGFGEVTRRAFVTDRDEIGVEELASPSEATTQGPIGSGELNDIGSFGDILGRALRQMGDQDKLGEVSDLTLVAVCASGHSTHLSGGKRAFRVIGKDGDRGFVPVGVTTEQIRAGRYRRTLRHMLEEDLRAEARTCGG